VVYALAMLAQEGRVGYEVVTAAKGRYQIG
jgi:hypothetical protein